MRVMHEYERHQHHEQRHANDQHDDGSIKHQAARECLHYLEWSEVVEIRNMDEKEPDAGQKKHQQSEQKNGQNAAMRDMHENLGIGAKIRLDYTEIARSLDRQCGTKLRSAAVKIWYDPART
jgi:hypothetical protein